MRIRRCTLVDRCIHRLILPAFIQSLESGQPLRHDPLESQGRARTSRATRWTRAAPHYTINTGRAVSRDTPPAIYRTNCYDVHDVGYVKSHAVEGTERQDRGSGTARHARHDHWYSQPIARRKRPQVCFSDVLANVSSPSEPSSCNVAKST